MKRRIEYFAHPPDQGDPEFAIWNGRREYYERLLERLIPYNRAWAEKHGEYRFGTCLVGAAVTDLHRKTGGNLTLVTDAVIEEVYAEIHPDHEPC